MRILHLAATLGPGGAERLVFELAREQIRQGYDVAVGLLRPLPRTNPGFQIDASRRARLLGMGVDVRTIAKGSRDVVRASRSLWRWMRAAKFDVVHAHTLIGAVSAGSRPAGPPVLWTIHNTEIPMRGLGLLLAAPGVDRYVACSSAVRESFDAALGRKLFTVVNGIDVQAFKVNRETLEREPSHFTMISVGGLRPQKNHVRMIRAMALAAPELVAQGVRPRLRIVGEGSERAAIEAEIDRLGVRDVVELLGAQSEIVELLATSDAYVMSSDHEGLPLALLEAMASGIPAVVTPFAGARDVIAHGESGLVAGTFAADDLASNIVWLGLHPRERRDLGRGALAGVCQYGLGRCAVEYSTHYESLAAAWRH